MRKGIQAYTIRDHLGTKEQYIQSLKTVREIGYDCIQMGVPSFMTAEEVRDFIDSIGLKSTSAYADFETMATDPAAIKAAIKQAKIFGSDLVGVGTLPIKYRDSREGFLQYAAAMNKIGQELYKEGCKLIYHPHALEFFSFGGGDHGMNVLFNDTDPSCVYFSLDTHWLASGGVNPVEWILKAKGRMPLVHFKDYAIGPDAPTIETVIKLFAEVGEGNLDWPKIIQACRDIGVEYVIVEQDICKGNPFDSLRTSYNNMVKFGV